MKNSLSTKPLMLVVIILSALYLPVSNAGAVDQLLKEYAAKSQVEFNAGQGKALWTKVYTNNDQSQPRSCSTCHTQNLTVFGKHAKTLKPIEPMAPSVNVKRLTDIKTINKWLLRNCKWTMGRECTPEEKGHLLTFIKSQ
jgi:hypothetical protein